MEEKKHTERILAFVSFCIEEYKALHEMDGRAVSALFEKYGVLDYLMEHYEILHTFGRNALLADIEHFICERRTK